MSYNDPNYNYYAPADQSQAHNLENSRYGNLHQDYPGSYASPYGRPATVQTSDGRGQPDYSSYQAGSYDTGQVPILRSNVAPSHERHAPLDSHEKTYGASTSYGNLPSKEGAGHVDYHVNNMNRMSGYYGQGVQNAETTGNETVRRVWSPVASIGVDQPAIMAPTRHNPYPLPQNTQREPYAQRSHSQAYQQHQPRAQAPSAKLQFSANEPGIYTAAQLSRNNEPTRLGSPMQRDVSVTHRSPVYSNTALTHHRGDSGDRNNVPTSFSRSPSAVAYPPHRQTPNTSMRTSMANPAKAKEKQDAPPVEVKQKRKQVSKNGSFRQVASTLDPAKQQPSQHKRATSEANRTSRQTADLKQMLSTSDDTAPDEMKSMLEKLLQYRAKDPSKFAVLFEEVKKAQPSGNQGKQPSPGNDAENSASNTSADTQAVEIAFQNIGSSLQGATRLPETTHPLDNATSIPSQPNRLQLDAQHTNPSTSQSTSLSLPNEAAIAPLAGYDQKASGTPKIAAAVGPPGEGRQFSRHQRSTSQTAQSSLNSPTEMYWPESRRQIVATVAKTALESYPQNAGKTVHADHINALLSQNPSYEQLCLLLEGQGWKFERSSFARTLLNGLGPITGREPTLANSSKPLSPPHSGQAVRPGAYHISPHLLHHRRPLPETLRTPAPAQAHSPAPTKSNIIARDGSAPGASGFFEPVVAALTPPYQAQQARSEEKRAGESAPIQQTSSTKQTKSPIPSSQKEPKNKEEAARKRKFADIVDLTVMDAEDERELREIEEARKRRALEPARERFVGDVPQLGYQSRLSKAANGFERFQNHASGGHVLSSREMIRNDMVVQPLNSSKAKRRSSYDPRTIARDFFLAKGEHPNMKPLNWHLEQLYGSFKHVKAESDLSSLRWDLIDPGEPIGNKVLQTHGQSVQNGDKTAAELGTATNDTSKLPEGEDSGESTSEGGVIPATNSRVKRNVDNLESAKTLARNSDSTPVSGQKKSGLFGANAASAVSSQENTKQSDTPPFSDFRNVRGSRSPVRAAMNVSRGSGRGRAGRQIGRPSRGSRVASTSQTIRVQSSGIPDTTPASFGAFDNNNNNNANTSGLKQTPKVEHKNAVDLSANGMAAPKMIGDHLPSGRLNETVPPYQNVSIVVPSFEAGTPLLDKNGTPARTHSSGKRVGRPPGSKNKPNESKDNSLSRASSLARDNGASPRRRGRPSGSTTIPSRGRGVGRGRSRGRVRGMSRPRTQYPIRFSMPDDGVGVLMPQPDSQSLPTTRENPSDVSKTYYDSEMLSKQRDRRFGRDDSIHHRSPAEYPDTNKFQVFKCRWRGCSSELHNLETLRKHVNRIHLEPYRKQSLSANTEDAPSDPKLESFFRCLWDGCDAVFSPGASQTVKVDSQDVIDVETPAPHVIQLLESHIEAGHMRLVARDQGDGPNVKPKAVDPSLFLRDRGSGAIVTPMIKLYGEGPPDPLLEIHHENRSEFTKAYHKAHGNLTKASKVKSQMYSKMALAADEDRLDSHGTKQFMQWKQMNMSGLRVEVPLSERALRELGIPENANMLEAWRDPNPDEEVKAARVERKQKRRRFQHSESGSDSEEDEESTGQSRDAATLVDQPAMFTSPRRTSMSIMARSTLQAGDDAADSEESDGVEYLQTLPVRVNEA